MTHDTKNLIKPVAHSEVGGVVTDNRGRNVWQWKDAQIDNTSIVLKRLENDALQLEPTRNIPIPKKLAGAKARSERGARAGEEQAPLSISETLSYKVGDGFDPYNRS